MAGTAALDRVLWFPNLCGNGGHAMSEDDCGVCFGDGYLKNSFGISNKCPACHGSVRRADEGAGIRDVTKTKASHFRKPVTEAEEKKRRSTPGSQKGIQLAAEIQALDGLSGATKETLIREIVAYEGTHGTCTKTFVSKMHKRMRTLSSD